MVEVMISNHSAIQSSLDRQDTIWKSKLGKNFFHEKKNHILIVIRNGQCWNSFPNPQVACARALAFKHPTTFEVIEIYPEQVFRNGVPVPINTFPMYFQFIPISPNIFKSTIGTGNSAITIAWSNPITDWETNNLIYTWTATWTTGETITFSMYFNIQIYLTGMILFFF
jgi:hypothetical protein